MFSNASAMGHKLSFVELANALALACKRYRTPGINAPV
jgi:hypothetical protein